MQNVRNENTQGGSTVGMSLIVAMVRGEKMYDYENLTCEQWLDEMYKRVADILMELYCNPQN
jgi:hypothetical protein